MSEFRVLPSVWPTGQVQSRAQRRGRYRPESMRHPAKMLPSIAARIIATYSRPGELVIDPMCGIGTTLVEAVHLGRNAAGMEYEPDFAAMAAANVLHARGQGATGRAQIVVGDARDIATAFLGLRAQAALVVTSPPYGASTHGHVRSQRDTGHPGGGVQKWNHRYSRDRGNLAHQSLDRLLAGFREILAGSSSLLADSGVVAITVRPVRIHGELVDLPGMVVETAEQAGLVLVDRIAALLAGLRDGRLVNRASFFQMLEARRARERGLPVCATAHEDLLILAKGNS